jgi:dUTP pyrophosphatase
MRTIPLQIKFVKVLETAKLPTRGSTQAAGLDLYAAEAGVVAPGQTVLVTTGLKMAVPPGYEAQIRSRSGLALRYSVSVLNSPGTIDEDYRGIVGVILHNHTQNNWAHPGFGERTQFVFDVGDRIAQMIITPCYTSMMSCKFVQVLDATERGEGGLGSTGR